MAEAIAEALAQLATKADIAALRAELKADIEILKRDITLRLGSMIVSNEPGYYKAGAYGIRVENLVLVQQADGSAEREMLGFETLTLAPIDRNLVDPSLLDEDEIAWLDAYHTRVRETLTSLVGPDTARWLAEATEPIRKS